MAEQDKLALVRAAGEAIRSDLAANVEARIEVESSPEAQAELQDVLARVSRNYLRQIIPDVETRVLIDASKAPEKTTMNVIVTGIISISVESVEQGQS